MSFMETFICAFVVLAFFGQYPYAVEVRLRREVASATSGPSGEWADWGAWGSCAATCGTGKRSRDRKCKTYQPCVGDKQETGDCPSLPCATWTEWTQWGQCSKMCGGGASTRNRQCSTYGGCQGNKTESNTCNPQSCCTEWTKWGPCSVTCGPGTQTRSKRCMIEDHTQPSGYASKEETETQPCAGKQYICAMWAPWGEWAACPVTCGGGKQERTRTCKPSGTGCPGNPNESQPCSPEPCPTWSEWTPWTQCSDTCGGGWQIRTRTCSKDGACPGDAKQKQLCNTAQCPKWGPWTDWGKCSKDCGGGTQTRTRTCDNDDAYCVGANATQPICNCDETKEKATASQDCNTFPCANYGNWADWGACSATCGGGNQQRARVCNNDAKACTGDMKSSPACTCQGDTSEANKCAQQKCPELGPWGAWGACSAPCGGGTQERKRPCQTDTAYCTADKSTDALCKCGDKLTDSQACNNQTCAKWGEWAAWSDCSVTCGKGTQTRKRQCQFDKNVCVGDKLNTVACKCDGNDTDTTPCDKGECYTWSSWSQWSECTVLCGGGSRNRSRGCPMEGGCPGLNDQTDICNQLPCPEWGDWSPWSDCSATCGGGQRARTRSCPIPKTCSPGEDYEADTTCSPDVCPTWADWTAWSTCSKTCGQGNRQRTRKCSTENGCLGSADNVEPCFDKACVLSTEWSQWSPCTQTCGGGTQTRSKVKCPAGPPTCPVDSESSKCQEQACPLWTEWGQWSACSKTCGGGQRIRNRTCPVTNGCIGTTSDIDPTPCNSFGCGSGKK